MRSTSNFRAMTPRPTWIVVGFSPHPSNNRVDDPRVVKRPHRPLDVPRLDDARVGHEQHAAAHLRLGDLADVGRAARAERRPGCASRGWIEGPATD